MAIRDWLDDPDEHALESARKEQQRIEAEAGEYFKSKVVELKSLAVEFYELLNEMNVRQGKEPINYVSQKPTVTRESEIYRPGYRREFRAHVVGTLDRVTERPFGYGVMSRNDALILTPKGETMFAQYEKSETPLKKNFFTGKLSQNAVWKKFWIPQEPRLETASLTDRWRHGLLHIEGCHGKFCLTGPESREKGMPAGSFIVSHIRDLYDGLEEYWVPLDKQLADHIR